MSKQTANVGKRRIEIAYVKLAELVPDPRNPRKMSDDQRARLRRGLEEFGLVDPFIVRRADKLVVGGHQRLKEAIALGFEEGPVVYLDQLNDQEAMALNILLNNPHAQGEFDMKMLSDSLSELDAEGMDATLTGFDEEQIQEIVTFEGSEGGGGRGSSDENFDPTPPEKPKAERGDLYVLGRHRLLCGDSMDAADVERLLDGHKTDAVFCDPPMRSMAPARASPPTSRTTKSSGHSSAISC
jgi:hypothetical protein